MVLKAPPTNIEETDFISGVPTPSSHRMKHWFIDVMNHVNGRRRTSHIQNIDVDKPIEAKTDIIRVNSATSGDVTVTGDQIVKGYDGQILKVVGTHDTKTVTLRNGDGLKLTGGNVTLNSGKVIDLHYDGILNSWVENSRN